MSHVIVIGGGAAGLMAAYSASMSGHSVTLLEKNEKLGKKIYITGKGRCNFTNASDMEEFFPQVMTNPKFLYSAFYAFSNWQMMDLMEQNGTAYKIERGNRVFPVSDKAYDVTNAMERACKKNGVSIKLHQEVKRVLMDDEGKACGVEMANGNKLDADAVVVATGGVSYPSTGSTGDGYRFAKEAGLKVTDVRPSLVPFNTDEDYVPKLQGLSLKNVSLTIFNGKGKKIYDAFGEMMFTHFGITGPIVLSASGKIGKYIAKEPRMHAEINLKAALTPEQLDARMQREIEEKQNKNFANLFSGVLPGKIIPIIVELSGIDPEKKINSVTREERASIVHLMQHFPVTINGTRSFKEAIITQGGVSVKEINPSTMESKKVPGLYFAGEVIDVDALTGGYNLQIAWSTGYLAGISIM